MTHSSVCFSFSPLAQLSRPKLKSPSSKCSTLCPSYFSHLNNNNNNIGFSSFSSLHRFCLAKTVPSSSTKFSSHQIFCSLNPFHPSSSSHVSASIISKISRNPLLILFRNRRPNNLLHSTSEPNQPSANTLNLDKIQDLQTTHSFKKKTTSLLYAFLAVFLHLAIGTTFHVLISGWSILDSLYFCIVTTTTVGYGDLSPSDSSARIFTAIYAMVSVLVIGSFLQKILAAVFERQSTRFKKLAKEKSTEYVSDSESKANWTKFKVTLALLLLIVLIGLAFFMICQSMSFWNAFYFIVISLTTVGYGDNVPKSPAEKVFAVFWLTSLTVGFLIAASDYANAKIFDEQLASYREELNSKVNLSDVKNMDMNSDGKLTKEEYILAMLVRMKVTDTRTIVDLAKRFDELDVDKSGSLDEKDFDLSAATI